MSQQQTILRVRTNNVSDTITGTTSLSVYGSNDVTYGGTGTTASPITGTTTSGNYADITILVSNGNGIFSYSITAPQVTGRTTQSWLDCFTYCSVEHANGFVSGNGGFQEYNTGVIVGSFQVYEGDKILLQFTNTTSYTNFNFSVIATEKINDVDIPQYDYLDLYDDIPIKINKSFAELQDISKRNSDYSIGLQLPGSKRNNVFFESFFNVDVSTLFFDVTKRVPCNVTINDEVFFRGYLRLNKASVINSKNEYDVTLFSNVGDLFGKIGNNLLNALDYDDIDFHFNHYFNIWNTLRYSSYNAFLSPNATPFLWSYPIIHNGYNYSGDTVQISGTTELDVVNETRLYTSTASSGYTSYSAFTGATGQEYRINSPKHALLDNQLKPALSIWGLFQLIFKTYGYAIKSDFLNSPWFKLLNMYGFYNSDTTKFSYNVPQPTTYSLDNIDLAMFALPYGTFYAIPVIKGTGFPCLSTSPITFHAEFNDPNFPYYPYNYIIDYTIPANTTGYTENTGLNLIQGLGSSPDVSVVYTKPYYLPTEINTNIPFIEGVYVNFSNVINPDLKQIDILASVAKKFDLIFVPDPNVENQIIIEPYDYYIGTGVIHDWTNLISYDTGWSVQPSLNFIESEIILTDLEDGDDGNKQFKDRNFRLYGENRVFNPTDFKSQTKKIETTFSPEIIRKWDNNIGLPLGINYVSSNSAQSTSNTEKVRWEYKGIKTKPKLFFNLGNLSPFLDTLNETYFFPTGGTSFSTSIFRMQKSDGTNIKYFSNDYAYGTTTNQSVSHTMPIGNPDSNKSGRGFNNDSICILFNSQLPQDIGIGIPTYNCYTDNDAYLLFYQDRVNNIFNKNTRLLEGNFYLKYSDILNLRVNDLIKVQQQYFTVNKIDGYNLTNQELTKVELLQVNVEPKTYPTRYFNYQYCGDSAVYKFRTYFNPLDNPSPTNTGTTENSLTNFRRTYYFWSILYDYFVGVLGGAATGYTSSITSQYGPFGGVYAYSIWEVNEDDFNASGISHIDDLLNVQFIDGIIGTGTPNTDLYYQNPWVWLFSNTYPAHYRDVATLNLATNCSNFLTLCSSNFVQLSTHPGSPPISNFNSGITINVTSVGWIKYQTASGQVYKQITSLGNYDIPDCALCSSVNIGIPFAQVAVFTITDCGSPC